MKKLLINILCGFIPGRATRNRVRMNLNNPIRKYTTFAKSFSNKKHPSVRYTYGYRCANFVVTIDNKFVFKFPLHNNGWEKAIREQRITDALRPISPIKIPDMEIIDFDGLAVRKYEYIAGVGFHHLKKEVKEIAVRKFVKQLANFLYIVGKADPKEIADLKPKKSDKPSVMHGWNQNDLWDNFILNPKTFDIVGIIDWEDAAFTDFHKCFTDGTGCSAAKVALLYEYSALYFNTKKHR